MPLGDFGHSLKKIACIVFTDICLEFCLKENNFRPEKRGLMKLCLNNYYLVHVGIE